MNPELDDEEKVILRRAVERYLSDLREEIVKTEKHEWKVELHRERDVLMHALDKLG